MKHRDRRLILYVNENMDKYFKNTRKNSIAKLIFKNWIWIETKIDSNYEKLFFEAFGKCEVFENMFQIINYSWF